jgi:hypothetical protein
VVIELLQPHSVLSLCSQCLEKGVYSVAMAQLAGSQLSYISKMSVYYPGFHWFSQVSRFLETWNLETWISTIQTQIK